MSYCYFNGKIIPTEKATLGVTDIGLLRGYAAFDFLRTYNGKPFLLDAHLTRFWHSAALLHLRIPVTKTGLKKIITALLKKNHYSESTIRIFITGGELRGSLGFQPTKPTFFILVAPVNPLPKALYRNGVRLITHTLQRELHEAKTSNYLSAAKMQREYAAKGAFETLYVYNGHVLEAATSNIFIVKRNVLITPKHGVLIGRTRNLVMTLAKGHYRVQERAVTVSELRAADEVFLTATLKDVLPVVKVDNKKIANGKVGPVTKHILEYASFCG
jgi:branched-subunit amino acid aminotransferase/4-amino-4-deoxychorismate lyase